MSTPEQQSANVIDGLETYLNQSETYRNLREVQQKGWESKDGDRHFRERRERSRAPNPDTQQSLFNMMIKVGEQMDDTFKIFSSIGEGSFVLDIGMAPGGFSEVISRRARSTRIFALTLEEAKGGYKVMCRPRINLSVKYGDVTSYRTIVGPKSETTLQDSPPLPDWLAENRFDLIICGAQALAKDRESAARDAPNEFLCVRYSQLYLALRKLRVGGSFVIVLNKATHPTTMVFLGQIHRFADVQMFKPERAFREKGIFYLIATNVRTEAPEAIEFRDKVGYAWLQGGHEGCVIDGAMQGDGAYEEIIESFGKKYLECAEPVWKVQLEALTRADWM